MEITTNMIIGSVLNLALFFAILYVAARKPVAKGLQDRSDKVADLLKNAETQLTEMSAKLAEQKRLLGDLTSQVAGIKANGEAVSQKLAEDVRAGARLEAEQMRARIGREVEAELALSRSRLRAELGREAIAQAERLLTERLDHGQQTHLVRDFATRLSGQGHSGNGHGGNN